MKFNYEPALHHCNSTTQQSGQGGAYSSTPAVFDFELLSPHEKQPVSLEEGIAVPQGQRP